MKRVGEVLSFCVLNALLLVLVVPTGEVTKNMLGAAKIGRQTANGPIARAKRANTQRKKALAQHS
jgi:hypothetical protein